MIMSSDMVVVYVRSSTVEYDFLELEKSARSEERNGCNTIRYFQNKEDTYPCNFRNGLLGIRC